MSDNVHWNQFPAVLGPHHHYWQYCWMLSNSGWEMRKTSQSSRYGGGGSWNDWWWWNSRCSSVSSEKYHLSCPSMAFALVVSWLMDSLCSDFPLPLIALEMLWFILVLKSSKWTITSVMLAPFLDIDHLRLLILFVLCAMKGPEGEDAGRASRMLMSMRFSDVIIHLVSFGIGTSPSVLAQVLLISHHPLITLDKSNPGATWHRMQKLNPEIPKLLAG